MKEATKICSPQAMRVDRQAAIPLYHQIEKHFSDLISRDVLHPGDQLPGVPSLIREINVNYHTVRQAYENLATAGLVRIIKGKGTFVADRALRSRTKTVVVLNTTPLSTEDGHNYYALAVYESIRATLEELGWSCHLRVIQPDVDPMQYAGRADGCIVFASTSTLPVLEQLHERSVSVVTISGNGELFSSVRSDDRQGIEMLIDHLVGLGHHRIALVGSSFETFHSRRRLDAYCQGMDRRGLDISPSWIYTSRSAWLEDINEQDELFTRLFEGRRPPTALIATSGYMGLSTLQMLHRHKVSVPEEVSVCAFDDSKPMAFASPPMTTIRQDPVKIGQLAVENLMAVLNGKSVESETLVPVTLIVRHSTAAPAKPNE
ncbi:MAG: substrate-binding domain-containing protein [Phycisphaerae bacterium]|nr:substrate-binding domain-containing protein [Phycisphaerae bacterium]